MKRMLLTMGLSLLGGLSVFLLLLLSTGGSVGATAVDGGKTIQSPAPATPAACGPGWVQVTSPATFTPVAVTASGPADAWAAGGSTLIHWNGSAWSVAAYPTPPPQPTYTSATDNFMAVSSRGASDMWAVGITDQEPVYLGDSPAAIVYWSGTAWQRVSYGPTGKTQANSAPDGAYFSAYNMKGVTDVGPGEAWVVGVHNTDAGSSPIVVHYCLNGGACPGTTPVIAHPGTTNLTAAASTGPNDVYIVGYDSTGGLIYHWNGSTWTNMTHEAIGNIQAVAAQVPNEAWAAGTQGILHFDGTSWSKITAPAWNYKGIAIRSQQEIWAVSTTGFAYGDASGFAQAGSPSGATGIALDVANGDDMWAVGPNLLHYPNAPIFTDVPLDNTFYEYIEKMACNSLVSGYNASPPCTTGTPCYRPNAFVSRGQMAKFISNAAGYTDTIPATTQTFTDVPHTHTFWLFIERVHLHGIVTGYTNSPPCTTGTPCYLPGVNVSRGQTAKFVSNARGYMDTIPPTQQTFTDVPPTNTFWLYIERAYVHSVIGGYSSNPPCTGGTPCFLPGADVTRGQMAKFVANAFLSGPLSNQH